MYKLVPLPLFHICLKHEIHSMVCPKSLMSFNLSQGNIIQSNPIQSNA